MKRFLLPLILILASFSVNAQQDVTKMLTSGKWFVVSTQEKGEKPEQAEDKNDEWILFSAEGKVEESYFGETMTCEWEYSKKDKTIKIIEDNDIKIQKILEVSKDKLVVEFFEDINNTDQSLIITYAK